MPEVLCHIRHARQISITKEATETHRIAISRTNDAFQIVQGIYSKEPNTLILSSCSAIDTLFAIIHCPGDSEEFFDMELKIVTMAIKPFEGFIRSDSVRSNITATELYIKNSTDVYLFTNTVRNLIISFTIHIARFFVFIYITKQIDLQTNSVIYSVNKPDIYI